MMAFRLLFALVLTIGYFPFVITYALSSTSPEVTFAFSRANWLAGVVPIAVGWILFLVPGLIFGKQYYAWVGRKTGLTPMYLSLVSRITHTSVKVRSVVHSRPKVSLAGLRTMKLSQLQTLAKSIMSKKAKPAPDATSVQPLQEDRPLKTDHVARAKAAVRDSAKHIPVVKEKFNKIKNEAVLRFTPDELQKTINLNLFTLRCFAHLKHVGALTVDTAQLEESEAGFCRDVIDALPEAPSPSDEFNTDVMPQSFSYPENRQQALIEVAIRQKTTLKHQDFVEARNGDLEKALFIVKVILTDALGRTQKASSVDDVFLGLPVGSN